MTVKERVIASRLIEKTERNGTYVKQIGLYCNMAITTDTVLKGKNGQKLEMRV